MPSQMDQADYQALVTKAVDTIRKGGVQKVVTSRSEARKLPDDYDLLALFERLAAKLESAFVTLIFLPGEGAWLVGTPETLLSTVNNTVSTVALAGTQWLEDTSDLRSVGWPDKLIEEQAIVSSDIRKILQSVGILDFQEQGPRTVRAANLVHLQSKFLATFQSDFDQKLEALLIALHPTSAVCGMPKKAAFDFIGKNEGYDRSYYTGFIGPVNFDGGTDLYVNLRTAQIIGNTAFLYVGGGIVENSVPLVEWQETVEKTKSIGSIL
jgi:isochorismate synthase